MINFTNDINWFLSPVVDQLQLDEHNTSRIARILVEAGNTSCFLTQSVSHDSNYRNTNIINLSSSRLIIDEIHSLHQVIKTADDLKFFGVHGSSIDGSFIRGWSDIDCIAVIDTDALTSPSRLIRLKLLFNKINSVLKQVDPYCHHGALCLPESILNHYDDRFPPIFAYNQIVGIKGELPTLRVSQAKGPGTRLVNIQKMICEFMESGLLKHHSYYGRYLESNYRVSKQGFYQLKYLINVCSNIPCLWLSDNNSPSDKSVSFEIAREYIGNHELFSRLDDIRCIDWESESKGIRANEIPQTLLDALPTNFLRMINSCIQNLIEVKYELS